jgi:formiminoglutamase
MFEFLNPIDTSALEEEYLYTEGQYGKEIIQVNDEHSFAQCHVVIASVHEERGRAIMHAPNHAYAVREALYQLYHWHSQLIVGDLGEIKVGSSVEDSYAAICTIAKHCIEAKKKLIILGGSHDVTIGYYKAFGGAVEVTGIDAKIDVSINASLKEERFLLDLLTQEPNYIKHYNHIGFQTYFTHPHMMETLDQLKFDCVRVGKAKEDLFEIEPAIRNSAFVTIDVNALQHAFMPCNLISPNGFTGEEMCTLTRFAGLSKTVNIMGIHGYTQKGDDNKIGAIQIAQMIWYFIDGIYQQQFESSFTDMQGFYEYHTALAGMDAIFLKSKNTGRWWMQVNGNEYIACTYKDYETARHGELPERWLRYNERLQ